MDDEERAEIKAMIEALDSAEEDIISEIRKRFQQMRASLIQRLYLEPSPRT